MEESSQNNIPVSIRLNPFKECDLGHLTMSGNVPWNQSYGRYLEQRPCFTLDPLFHAGAYYVQDASAMFPGWMFSKVLERFAPRRVLDLCAAPGGKTTDLLTSLRLAFGPAFVLVSNEVIRARASVLQDNVAMWGDPNVVVTSSDAADFGRIKGFFECIVADVPCSGEGMFRKSENARKMWSEDNVALCAARQKRIVADVWDALAPGGIMIYSTCTLNDSENDENVEWIAGELGAEVVDVEMSFEGPVKTRTGYLLEPGVVKGEGQFCAVLRKKGSYDARPLPEEGNPEFFDRKDEIYALPPALNVSMPVLAGKINVLGAGVHAFSKKGKDSIPCADLALSTILDKNDFPSVDLTLEDALHFLHKDALVLQDAPQGYLLVSYGGLPLGFVKNLGRRANNLHPAGRRILMNI